MESTVTQQISIAIPMRVLEVYTSAEGYKSVNNLQKVNSVLYSIWNYLICNQFFKQMRTLIDNKIPEPYESTSKAPTPLSATLLDLTLRPLKSLKDSNEQNANLIVRSFLSEALRGPHSPQIKYYVLTHLTNQTSDNIRAEYLIDCLLQNYSPEEEITISLDPNIWLFYSLVKLIGTQTTQINTKYTIKYLHILRLLSVSLLEITNSRSNSDIELEEIEMMDTSDNTTADTNQRDKSLVEDLISMLNEPTHVSVITSLIDSNDLISNSQTIISLSCLCHSLLSAHPLAVNQYRYKYTSLQLIYSISNNLLNNLLVINCFIVKFVIYAGIQTGVFAFIVEIHNICVDAIGVRIADISVIYLIAWSAFGCGSMESDFATTDAILHFIQLFVSHFRRRRVLQRR